MLKRLFFLFFIFIQSSCITLTSYKKHIKSDFIQRPRILSNEPSIIVDYEDFVISYNKNKKIANWVMYTLTADEFLHSKAKRASFKQDSQLSKRGIYTPKSSDYQNTGFDRGHLAPARDFSFSKTANDNIFSMANIVPQSSGLNRGAMKKLEDKVRKWALKEKAIVIVTGPLLKNIQLKMPSGVNVPECFFKVLLDLTPVRKTIAFKLCQTDGSGTNLVKKALSVDNIEQESVIDFFPNMHDEDRLEQHYNYFAW